MMTDEYACIASPDIAENEAEIDAFEDLLLIVMCLVSWFVDACIALSASSDIAEKQAEIDREVYLLNIGVVHKHKERRG